MKDGKLNTEEKPKVNIGMNWVNIVHTLWPSIISESEGEYEANHNLSQVYIWLSAFFLFNSCLLTNNIVNDDYLHNILDL